MITEPAIVSAVAALELPPGARVDARVPKKLLVEQGAPTSTDKRAIQDGIEEFFWIASLKPNNCAIPVATEAGQDYGEIAILALQLRAKAKTRRLIELVHRAVPYPVLLIGSDAGGVFVSTAAKRAAQNDSAKMVVEQVVTAAGLHPLEASTIERDFLASLALGGLPSLDLGCVYTGWRTRIEALLAARLTGDYAAKDESGFIGQRRIALESHGVMEREAAKLRAQATRTKQISRRVDLNQKIKAIEAAIRLNATKIMGSEV